MGEKGNYILAIIENTESYDNLRQGLANLIKEMSNLKEINVTVTTKLTTISVVIGNSWH